jgi:hypothetical protein
LLVMHSASADPEHLSQCLMHRPGVGLSAVPMCVLHVSRPCLAAPAIARMMRGWTGRCGMSSFHERTSL